ncbi:MAG: hypothetical protein B6D38_07555 [Anaerolineae bacterium UTCFX1]|jgi:two-component system cell cycle response regulator DivK|nr:MAG: hypothetical protein B6D38_07555 [Anaerolineae bacterium UTCFX1]
MAKILIIEDIPDNAELAGRILSSSGYEVIHAADAETGLQMALDHEPALILLDLGLPDHDGLTLAGWLRANPQTLHTPIVAFTAWPKETAQLLIQSYRCDGYIAKPITSVVEFVAQISSFIK